MNWQINIRAEFLNKKFINKLKKLNLKRQQDRLLSRFTDDTYDDIENETPVRTWLLKSRNKKRKNWINNYTIDNTQTNKMYYNIYVHEWQKWRKANPFFMKPVDEKIKELHKYIDEYIFTYLDKL